MTHTKTKELPRSPSRAGGFFAFILLFSLLAFPAAAQDESTPVDAASQGKGGIATTTSSPWSTFSNQGALGFWDHGAISLHQENRFLVKELNVTAVAATLPVKPGTIALAVSRFGYSLYNESRVMVAIGKRLWPSFSIGIGLGAHYIKVAEGYGHSSAYTVEAGILYSPTQNLSIGAHLFNPTAEKMGENPGKKLASGLSAGLSYAPTQGATLAVEVTEQERAATQIHAGIEATVIDQLVLRAGYASNPDMLCFGLGYSYKPFKVDLALTTNNPLGISGFLTVTYLFN